LTLGDIERLVDLAALSLLLDILIDAIALPVVPSPPAVVPPPIIDWGEEIPLTPNQVAPGIATV
jgi:hypothetical protein